MPTLLRTLRVAFVAILFGFIAARPALAANYDYTDNWYVLAEPGWGVNFSQTDNFIFATLFIYGPDKKPTWYTAQMTWDGTKFTGPLYATQGTWFAQSWNPADHPSAVQVGTATFTPSNANNYQGTFSYNVSGVATVVKAVERLTLTPIALAANYVGGQAGTYGGCSTAASNRDYHDFFTLQVSQSGTNVTLAFSYDKSTPPLTCTIAGNTTQSGSILRMTNATYQCSDGLNTTAFVSDLRATPLGIEGQFFAPDVGGNCSEAARFSATLN